MLHDDEKELGVALVDIGGGTTDLAIFTDGAIVHTSVLAVGGHQLTADIAYGLRSPHSEAERIKHKHGCAMVSMVGEDEMMEVPSVGGRPARSVKRQSLCAVIEPRVEEIFMLVRREIEKNEYDDKLASGVVITGGSTILEGMPELAEEVLGMPVRRGAPMGVGGLVDVVRSPVLRDRRRPRPLRREEPRRHPLRSAATPTSAPSGSACATGSAKSSSQYRCKSSVILISQARQHLSPHW